MWVLEKGSLGTALMSLSPESSPRISSAPDPPDLEPLIALISFLQMGLEEERGNVWVVVSG